MLGFSGTPLRHKLDVLVQMLPFPVWHLLRDRFFPEVLAILCAQWCSLSIIFCRITEDSAVTTFEALKARVRELERQLSRGDRYKCLICMVSSIPLVVMNQKCFGVFAEEGRSFSSFGAGVGELFFVPIHQLAFQKPTRFFSSWNFCMHYIVALIFVAVQLYQAR